MAVLVLNRGIERKIVKIEYLTECMKEIEYYIKYMKIEYLIKCMQ